MANPEIIIDGTHVEVVIDEHRSMRLSLDEAQALYRSLRLFQCIRGDEAAEFLRAGLKEALTRVDQTLEPLRQYAAALDVIRQNRG